MNKVPLHSNHPKGYRQVMNKRFCFVVGIMLIAASKVIAAQAPPPLHIMPLGDSITQGTVPGGYRLPLYQLLTNAGYNIDFVGSTTVNGAPNLPDSDHEGHSGWRIDQIDSIILGVFGQIADPDIILVLIGTNDYGQNYDTAHATNRLESLVVKMATARPNAKIIVANLLARGEPYNTQIQNTFNPFLPSMVARQQSLGRQVYFDDLRSAVPLSDMPDQLHPGQVGYQKMATNWFGVISSFFTPQGSTNPPTLSRAYTSGYLTNVMVVFSKPVADDAAVATNYFLSGGLLIKSATLDPVTKQTVTLATTPQQPFTYYTLTVNGVHDRTTNNLPLTPNSTLTFQSSAGHGAMVNVPEAAGYTLVYSLNIPNSPNYSNGITYDLDQRGAVSSFSRIGYYLELQTSNGAPNFVWVSMDAFTTNVNQIGVPTVANGAVFQQPVAKMNVLSSVASIINGTNLAGGNLEFWPSNSSPLNSAKVPTASDASYDWGDAPTPGNYGSMQIHNHSASQVLFAFNRWGGVGGIAEVGIGNNGTTGNYLDWTGSQNAAGYTTKMLQIFALPASPQLKLFGSQSRSNGLFSLSWAAKGGVSYSVLRKPTLDSTPWTKVGGITVTTNTTVSLEFPALDASSFYRLSIP